LAPFVGVSYATLRSDIKYFQSKQLIMKKGSYIKLNRLIGIYSRLSKLYKQRRDKIQLTEKPAVYFADLFKSKVIFANVVSQACKEADKISDRKIARKYLKQVRSAKTFLGLKEGINLAVKTIGKLLGRSKVTAQKYVTRMHDEGIIRKKGNRMAVCTIEYLKVARKQESVQGRLFIDKGIVYERLTNSYFFAVK
jgi:hypothetical protein